MDFADATLVALAEELDCTSVVTTDRTDVPVYRIHGRKSFRLLPNHRAGAPTYLAAASADIGTSRAAFCSVPRSDESHVTLTMKRSATST